MFIKKTRFNYWSCPDFIKKVRTMTGRENPTAMREAT